MESNRPVEVLVFSVGMLVSLSVVVGMCSNHESDKDPNGTPRCVFGYGMDILVALL